MLPAYVRRYVSTWRERSPSSLPTVHPLSRCCFRGVFYRSYGVPATAACGRPRCIYAPRVKRLAAESRESFLPFLFHLSPDPSSRSSASSCPSPPASLCLPSSVPLPPRRPYGVRMPRRQERIRTDSPSPTK